VSTFLSSAAVLLSTLALLCSGFAAYQVYTLRQTVETVNNSSNSSAIAPNGTINAQASPTPTETSTPKQSPTPTTTTSAIQAGQFVQPAFGNKAKVELLSVKRIKDPESGNRDVVNVQMRVRRLAVDNTVTASDIVSISETTARNPDTSETYKGVDLKRSTGPVSLFQLRPQASADAYVWLRVPEAVNTLDLFVPDTAAFKNVPISTN
jgi:hypothetical protein